jgi:hypothetical protein
VSSPEKAYNRYAEAIYVATPIGGGELLLLTLLATDSHIFEKDFD